MPFLMDSSAFIQAKNFFYRFSFCPGFWDWVGVEHASGNLYSVTKVEEELLEGKDELKDWATNIIPAQFFIKPTPAVVTTQAVIAQWVTTQREYTPAEQAKFLSKADPWLVAEAIQGGYEIITFEELVPSNSSKIKIPNVAGNFGVKSVKLFDVIEASGARLRL